MKYKNRRAFLYVREQTCWSLDRGGNADNNRSKDPFSSLKSSSRILYRHSKGDTPTKCTKYEC